MPFQAKCVCIEAENTSTSICHLDINITAVICTNRIIINTVIAMFSSSAVNTTNMISSCHTILILSLQKNAEVIFL